MSDEQQERISHILSSGVDRNEGVPAPVPPADPPQLVMNNQQNLHIPQVNALSRTSAELYGKIFQNCHIGNITINNYYASPSQPKRRRCVIYSDSEGSQEM